MVRQAVPLTDATHTKETDKRRHGYDDGTHIGGISEPRKNTLGPEENPHSKIAPSVIPN